MHNSTVVLIVGYRHYTYFVYSHMLVGQDYI